MLISASLAFCQQSEEEKKFYADYADSERKTVAAYPDAANFESKLSKRMVEMEAALKTLGDPRYYSADKPMILAQMAAKELGIKSVMPAEIENPPSPNFEDEVIPEFHSYKSVRVRKIEPDGLRILHETGATKIPIEELSVEQRSKYGITAEGAAKYRQQVAAYALAYNAQQREAAIQAQAAEVDRRAREEAERIAVAEYNARAEASSQAAMQKVEDHYQAQAEQGREAAERDQKRFQDEARERRLRKLEQDAEDRLNRERESSRR